MYNDGQELLRPRMRSRRHINDGENMRRFGDMAAQKYSCFVISPIGNEGTEIHEEYQKVLDYLIRPALQIFEIKVSRGDHYVNDTRIDDSVIQKVQDSDICICDITMPNPNVYYELGRRVETGKPLILLQRAGTPESPVNLEGLPYISYDWSTFITVKDAQTRLRAAVKSVLDQGLEQAGASATLGDIASSISRLERKLSRRRSSASATSTLSPAQRSSESDTSPDDRFRYALLTRNIPMAEQAMDELQVRMEKLKFYDLIVEQAAAMGSRRAGEMLIDMAEEFMDSSMSFRKKVEYLGSLVSFANRSDTEQENRELVEKLCRILEAQSSGEDPENVVQIHNQKNRLYYGLYTETEDPEVLRDAIDELQKALRIGAFNFLYYNLAMCLERLSADTGDQEALVQAKEAIESALALDEKKDGDHYEMACKIYYRLQDPKFEDTYAVFDQLDHVAATLLLHRLRED